MYKTIANPERVLPRDSIETNFIFLRMAREGKLHEAGPLYAFEMIEEQKQVADYVIFNGHHRLEAAKQAGLQELELIVVETGADFGDVPGTQAYPEEDFEDHRGGAVRMALELRKMVFDEIIPVKLDSSRVVPSRHRDFYQDHVEMAENGTLDEVGPIRVFELPEEYKDLGDYVVIDGHHRLEATKRAGVDVLALVMREHSNFRKYTYPWHIMTEQQFENMRIDYGKQALEFSQKNSK